MIRRWRRDTVWSGMTGVIAAAVTLAGCGMTPDGLSPVLPPTEVGSGLTTPTATTTTDDQAKPFDPFRQTDTSDVGRREVIAKPTLAQVLERGPLEEITVGKPDAPVTVIKYFSPTCPYCRVFQRDTYPQLKREYVDTGKVRIVFREFPIGFQSGAATIAIRCAPEGKRLALYAALLDQQARWVSQDVRRDPIFAIARNFGIDRADFDACYQNQAMIEGLKQVKDRGRTLGIIGTPNFFIDNRLEKRVLTIADFRAIIDPILAGASATAEVKR